MGSSFTLAICGSPDNTVSNGVEQAADSKDLSEYLHKIGEGAVNSPLVTSDSNQPILSTIRGEK